MSSVGVALANASTAPSAFATDLGTSSAAGAGRAGPPRAAQPELARWYGWCRRRSLAPTPPAFICLVVFDDQRCHGQALVSEIEFQILQSSHLLVGNLLTLFFRH